MDIYKNIREIRLQKGINQQALADALNLDVAVISKIEKGKRDLRVKELEISSNVLGLTVVDLLTYPQQYVNIIDIPRSDGRFKYQVRIY